MTLSHWVHWRWLSILSLEAILAIATSVSWLCRCIWWLSVSWSYVTQWRHWLRHSTALKSLREDFRVNSRWITWHWSWLHAKLQYNLRLRSIVSHTDSECYTYNISCWLWVYCFFSLLDELHHRQNGGVSSPVLSSHLVHNNIGKSRCS